MTDTVPHFPAVAPPVFADARQLRTWFDPLFAELARVVDGVTDADLARPTPCDEYDVRALLAHTLGWADFFGAAFADPTASGPRPDPETFAVETLGEANAKQIVERAAARIDAALAEGVLSGRILLSQSTMDGPAAAAMALGEYIIHGWDLATATGQTWTPADDACQAAYDFFATLVTPEYRGPEGFFGDEVPVPAYAPILDRLLGFAGRDPRTT